jgi:acetolactate synthase I/II/III large subunit
MTSRSAARALVDQLRIHGARLAFCVPGESYLDVLDVLYDTPEIQLVSARHEGGAAFMAEAYGKLTGQPGVCLVTRGPGASNAMNGVHTAFHDATPMILLIGQVARGFGEREAFQEIDFRALFAPVSKWATQIDDPTRIPEVFARAFALATSGRPGPVVIALPEDMLAEQIDVPDAAPYQRAQGAPGPAQLSRARALLEQARRPLVIVGGGDWNAQAADDIRAFVAANDLPALASFRAQDVIDNALPQYIGALGVGGDPWLRERVKQADLLLVIGDRLSELPSDDYSLLAIPSPTQTLIHVYPDPDELGRVYQPALPIVSGMPECATLLRALAPVDANAWRGWRADARAAYEAYLAHVPSGALLDIPEVFAQLRARIPSDAIITNGAGNYTGLVHRYTRFSRHRSQIAPVNGTMGYGLPAAIACKLAQPERVVVAFAGDGCFMMNGQELATAAQYGVNVIMIVMNNNQLGTIRMHQERRFPGRVIGTDLVNPDFVAFARAFGAHGERVERNTDFAPALDRALVAGRPALIELRMIG